MFGIGRSPSRGLNPHAAGPDVSGFTALGHMANPVVVQIHRYLVLTVFFFQPIRNVVLSELRPTVINLGKYISAVFTGDNWFVVVTWVILSELDFNGVCRLTGWNETGVFKGENDSRRNLEGFMSRESKENAIKVENQVRWVEIPPITGAAVGFFDLKVQRTADNMKLWNFIAIF